MEYCDEKCYLKEMVMGLKILVSAAHKEFEHFRIYYAPRKCRCLQKLLEILVEKIPTAERLMKYTHNTTKRGVSPGAKSALTCIEMFDPKDQTYIWEMVDNLGRLLERAKGQLERLKNSRAPEMTSNLENLINVLHEKLPKAKQILDDTCKPQSNVQLEEIKNGDTSNFKSGKQSNLKFNQKMHPVEEMHLQGKNISKQPFELDKLYERYYEIESNIKLLVRENMMLKDELMTEREHTAKIHEFYRTKFKDCSQCVELRKEVSQLLQEKNTLIHLKSDRDHVAELQKRKLSSMEQKVKSQEQEIAYLKLENETTGKLKKKLNELQHELDTFVLGKKDIEERLKQEQNHAKIKNKELLLTIENQEKEIARCRHDYDSQRQNLINEFKKISERMIQEKNEYIQKIKLEKENASKQNQSFITEENYKLQTALDKMRNECLRNTEELRRVKVNAEQKEGKYKNICLELKTIIDSNTQEISLLKSENLMYNKLKEKYQRCQQEAQQLLVENHKINENLRNENEKAKQNAAEYEQLNTVLLDLRKQHIEEKEDLKDFFDKQQSENDIQHQKHVDRLLEEIQKCKDDLVQNKENQNMQGGTMTHNIDLTCHNLQKEIDRLEKDNKTLREELESERRHVQKKEDDFKNIRSEIQTIMEEKELEINSLKVKYEKHQLAGREVLNKNERLLVDTENLRVSLQQEKAKAKTLENERDLVREELQQVKGEQFETMQKLKVVDDIQRKVSNANQELKEEMSLLRLENIKIKTELTSQQENARTHDAKEHEFDNQHKILREEIHKAKQQNEQLHLDNSKLNVQLHQEKDNVTKYKRELDIKSNEIQKLKQQQEEMYRKTMALSEDLSKQQDNARKQEESNSKLIQEIDTLQEKLHQIQNENEHLLEELNSVKEVAEVQEDHRTKIISFQQIISNQDKEILRLKTETDTQNDVYNNNLNTAHQQLDEADKRNKVLIQEIENVQNTLEQHRQQIIKKDKIIDKQKNEIDKLESENKRLVAENRDKPRNSDSRLGERNAGEKGLQQQLAQMKEQLTNAQKELDDTKSRLSRAMGDKLTDNNPNIADLSDRNRPTKISERYQELYDNQWTDAFEIIDGKIGNEETTIKTLIDILLETMDYCRKQSANQMTTITETLSKGKELSASTMKQLKDLRKASAENYGKELYLEYWKTINHSKSHSSKMATNIPQFVKECFELCWLMAVQDPPVVLGPEIRRDTPFNKDHYKAYTKSGNKLDYIVWPVLLLHQDGPVLCKGVAQGH